MAEWDKSQHIDENFPLVKEARLHNVWIYEPAAQKGERWMTPDEFIERYKHLKVSNMQTQKFMKDFKLMDPRDFIDEFDKRINVLQKEKSIFLDRIKKHYGKA